MIDYDRYEEETDEEINKAFISYRNSCIGCFAVIFIFAAFLTFIIAYFV